MWERFEKRFTAVPDRKSIPKKQARHITSNRARESAGNHFWKTSDTILAVSLASEKPPSDRNTPNATPHRTIYLI